MSDTFADFKSTYYPSQFMTTQPVKTTVAEVTPAAVSVNDEKSTDTVELSTQTNEKPKKKGPIKKLKGFIANVKKTFATISEYTKGTLRGIKNAVVGGSIVYTAGNIANYFKTKSAQKAGEETVKKIPNKLLAGIVAVGAIGTSIWQSSLNATQRGSEIEHRWTGHNK
jgi:hypothetical protein